MNTHRLTTNLTTNLTTKTLFVLSVTLLSMAFALIPATGTRPASAQCGADASSCKRCHQGEEAFPVNDLGQWHVDHAAQDFCQLCHGGDKTTDDAGAAHAGMFDPLGAQGLARCTACHPADGQPKIDAYTDLLASYTSSGNPAATDPPGTSAELSSANTTTGAGYDWRNIALAGFAGFLTAVSGVIVWNVEDLGSRARRS